MQDESYEEGFADKITKAPGVHSLFGHDKQKSTYLSQPGCKEFASVPRSLIRAFKTARLVRMYMENQKT